MDLYHMGRDLIEQAHLGDLTGMNFAGLVRLSFELENEQDGHDRKVVPFTGRDIKGREQQTGDCRTYVEKRGGTYVHTYEEPDTSAYKRKRVRLPDGRTVYRVVRPVFEAALEDLKRREAPDGQRLDGLIVYDIDRLTRDNRHLEDAIEVVQHFRRPIIDITGTLDLLTDNGRTVARIIVATANKQSADTARRVTRKHRAMEQAGIPTGGNRPFGWLADKRALNEAEAQAIRDAAGRLIRGAPVAAVAVDWNKRGLFTPFGKPWVQQTIKQVMRNPRLCGYRSRYVRGVDPETGHEFQHVEIVRNEDGEPVVGQWNPIISVAEWEAVTAVIGSRPAPGRGDNARKYLLSGTLRCGCDGCGAKLRVTKKATKVAGSFYYVCPSSGAGGCGGTSIPGQKTDEFVSEAVISKFEVEAQRRNAVTTPTVWEREEELLAVREQIQDLTAAWRSRPQQISSARYFAMLPSLEQDERELSEARAAWLATTTTTAARPLTIRDDWENDRLTLPEKRAYIEEALIAVIVAAANGLKRWNPDRLTPVWRED
jgi:site-specific DNA recombinase